MDDIWDDDVDEPNVGLQFGSGFFVRSETAVNEESSEIISYLMPNHDLCVQAFLVDDFNGADDLGVEVIPHALKGVSYVRIARELWEFIEDVADCEHEAEFYHGLVLGQLLVGTAHRMLFEATGQVPGVF
jgi:hypothetical protein